MLEDFDNNESSRIAAGGFLILEVIQVGKLYKFVKGAKILSKTGKAVSASNRVIQQFTKAVTDDALIDISCQLLVNLVDEAIKNPTISNDEIIINSFSKINIKNAILGGMISYTSLDNTTKTSFKCARSLFTVNQKGGEDLIIDIKDGAYDCILEIAISVAFSKMKGTEKMQGVLNEFSDAAKNDILLSRIKGLTGENCYKYIEIIVKKAIKKI